MPETMTFDKSFHVPPRSGFGFEVKAGDFIRITDLKGSQAVDFWAFSKEDAGEFLSPQHTKPTIEKLTPRVGDAAYTNHRRAIVTVVADNSPGQHDMQYAACDATRYKQLGFDGPHASCQDNLHAALAKYDITIPFTPQPWNLFTNFVINPDGTFTIKPADTKPGDNIVLRAELDSYVVVSACPQDLNLTNGGNPTDVKVEVGR